MFKGKKLLTGKRRHQLGMLLLVSFFFVCAAFDIADSDDFDKARREVLLRSIGHELLLQSGDSTSRVLPVQKISENEYRIRFEQELTFDPDLLVNTTRRLLAKDPLAHDYAVSVLNCVDQSVAYGFTLSENAQDDVIACTGREQPRACYMINVKFKPEGLTAKNKYLLGSLPFIAIVGFIFFRPKLRKVKPANTGTKVFNLGQTVFNADERHLVINATTTDLTATETRLLLIFAQLPNQVIARSRLQKEIWEDEGVIVGRSLDMFISKLRKKLEPDANISIVVVRSKGYKLEINS